LATLSSVALCKDPRYLAAEVAPPAESIATEVQAVREELARAKALDLAERFEEAAHVASAAIEDARAVAYPPVLVEAINMKASLLIDAGIFDEARVLTDEAYTLSDAASRQAAMSNLMMRSLLPLLEERGASGLPEAERAVALATDAFGPEHVETAWAMAQLANVLSMAGDHKKALEIELRAYSIVRSAEDADDWVVAQLLLQIGFSQHSLGQSTEALESWTEALALAKSSGSSSHVLAPLESNLGVVMRQRGRYDEALEHHLRALEHANAWGDAKYLVAQIHERLARTYSSIEDYDRATQHYEKAVRLETVARGPESARLVDLYDALAQVRRKAGDAQGCLHWAQQELHQLGVVDAPAEATVDANETRARRLGAAGG